VRGGDSEGEGKEGVIARAWREITAAVRGRARGGGDSEGEEGEGEEGEGEGSEGEGEGDSEGNSGGSEGARCEAGVIAR
jgi:hypothetical protein